MPATFGKNMINLSSPILLEDFKNLDNLEAIDWEVFNNKTFLITGSTGFVGSLLVKYLCHRNDVSFSNVRFILPVRSIEKAKSLLPNTSSISYIESPIETLPAISNSFDYVIHCASPTKSKFFIEKPVETLDTILLGTKHLLDICKKHHPQKILYLSSMESYGTLNAKNVRESDQGYTNPLDTRSSYSLGKRAAELYCHNYFSEYNLPIVIIRLAMCFGSGLLKTENRVYKSFMDAALAKKDIEVRSTGTTRLNFAYTTDALQGLFLALEKGNDGEAYNLSSKATDYTIMDMANYIASKTSVKVIKNIPEENQGFAPDNSMTLNLAKIKSLGYIPYFDIESALSRTFEYLKHEEETRSLGSQPHNIH